MEMPDSPVFSRKRRREEWEEPVREQYHSPDDITDEEECCPRDFDDYPHSFLGR